MGVDRCVLNDDAFGRHNPERGEVPERFDTGCDKTVGNGLGAFDGNSDDSYSGAEGFAAFGEFSDIVDGDSGDFGADNRGVGVESGNYFEPVALQAVVGYQRCAETADSDDDSLMVLPEAEKV